VGQGSIQVSIRYQREPRICGAIIAQQNFGEPIISRNNNHEYPLWVKSGHWGTSD
jgi:hypothetical protein